MVKNSLEYLLNNSHSLVFVTIFKATFVLNSRAKTFEFLLNRMKSFLTSKSRLKMSLVLFVGLGASTHRHIYVYGIDDL